MELQEEVLVIDILVLVLLELEIQVHHPEQQIKILLLMDGVLMVEDVVDHLKAKVAAAVVVPVLKVKDLNQTEPQMMVVSDWYTQLQDILMPSVAVVAAVAVNLVLVVERVLSLEIMEML